MRDRGAARHEAGHALIAMALGLYVVRAFVEQDRGVVEVRLPSADGTPGTAAGDGRLSQEQAIFVLLLAAARDLGGPVADSISGRRWDGQREEETTCLMIEAESGVPGALWLPVLRETVRRYLRQHWHLVETIAGALLQHGTMGDADLRALIGEVPPLDLNPVLRRIEHHVVRARARARVA